MIVYFAFGAILVALLVLAGRALARANPRRLAQALRIAAVVLCLGAAAAAVASGRIGLAPLFGLLIPLITGWRSLSRRLRTMAGPTPGRQSGVKTETLRMRLDHDTGAISGTVLKGRYRGRTLDELGLPELVDLLRTCRIEDPQAAALLEAYLDRTAADWRDAENADAENGRGPADAARADHLSVEEAYSILGLAPGAGPDEIRRAHRELMLKVHPDRGGSAYLAARINAARDLLLRT